MEIIWKLPLEIERKFKKMEQEAYSKLVIGDYQSAESIYKEQYEIFLSWEKKLPLTQKYHKGGPLHNRGIALLYQKKIIEGFQLITFAYIEDLFNIENIEEVYKAPAYRTLNSYPLISKDFLKNIKQLVIESV